MLIVFIFLPHYSQLIKYNKYYNWVIIILSCLVLVPVRAFFAVRSRYAHAQCLVNYGRRRMTNVTSFEHEKLQMKVSCKPSLNKARTNTSFCSAIGLNFLNCSLI